MGLLSRVKGWWGNRRAIARDRQSASDESHRTEVARFKGAYDAFGYRSAEVAINDGRVATSASGDAHQKYSRTQLVAEARRLERDNPIFQGMIDKAISYIVGNGFKAQARSADPEWNKKAEELWRKDWVEGRPEVTGLDAGYLVEQMVGRELLACGDVGVLKTPSGKVQIVESEQIAGPGSSDDGIERSAAGTVTGYYAAQYDRNGITPSKAKKYSPEEFLFLVRRKRPSSYRAVPPLQAAFAMLHRINDLCDSEAIAAQLLARFVIAVNRPNAANLAQQLSTADGSSTEGKVTTRVTDVGDAIIVSGERGDEFKGIERNVPGKDFPTTIETFLRLLGLPLGLPLEITLLNWTKSNYSQSKAVLEQAKVGFDGWQGILELNFHGPVYRWFVDRWIGEQRLPPREDRYQVEFIKPTFPWLDALQEANAWGAKLDRSLCTLHEALQSQNKDRDEVLVAREREIRQAIAIAQRIEKELGIKVPWQIFAGLSFSVNAAPASAKPEEKADAK